MKIKKQDQIIIQKKIDGILSPTEEIRFNELMETSPEARSYYHKLTILHHTLNFDSAHISGIDLSDRIIQSVNPENKIQRPFREKIYHFNPVRFRQMLVYAALLIFGLIFGSVVTYFGSSSHKLPDSVEVSGTVAKSSGNRNVFNQAGTEINFQDFESGDFRMLMVEIETADTVLCTFRNADGAGSPEKLKLLYSKGSFQITRQDGDRQNYLCCGRNIFVINTEGVSDKDSIRFFRKDKLIYDHKLN